jgi:hypothetical protein
MDGCAWTLLILHLLQLLLLAAAAFSNVCERLVREKELWFPRGFELTTDLGCEQCEAYFQKKPCLRSSGWFARLLAAGAA